MYIIYYKVKRSIISARSSAYVTSIMLFKIIITSIYIKETNNKNDKRLIKSLLTSDDRKKGR